MAVCLPVAESVSVTLLTAQPVSVSMEIFGVLPSTAAKLPSTSSPSARTSTALPELLMTVTVTRWVTSGCGSEKVTRSVASASMAPA